MKKLLLIAIVGIIFFGCKKENTAPEIKQPDFTGKIYTGFTEWLMYPGPLGFSSFDKAYKFISPSKVLVIIYKDQRKIKLNVQPLSLELKTEKTYTLNYPKITINDYGQTGDFKNNNDSLIIYDSTTQSYSWIRAGIVDPASELGIFLKSVN